MYFYQYTLLLRYLLLFPTSFYSFFFNDTATTEIYTLSLHDALPICGGHQYVGNATRCMTVAERADGTSHPIARRGVAQQPLDRIGNGAAARSRVDRKSTRLNSSHSQISYAVFCLKKKKHDDRPTHTL